MLIWLSMSLKWRYSSLLSQSTIIFSLCWIWFWNCVDVNGFSFLFSLSLSLTHTHTHLLSEHFFFFLNFLFILLLKVDLTAYVEKHEFCFDAVLNEHVTNDEVIVLILQIEVSTCCLLLWYILNSWNYLYILIEYFFDVYHIAVCWVWWLRHFCLM